MVSKLYSGYLHMGDQHFHYVYSEAIAVNPATAPVALWLNGEGPTSLLLLHRCSAR